MASLNKQHRRAQRAKVKAKHTRIQRAGANSISCDDIGFEPVGLGLDERFLGASSVELSVHEDEFGFVMTAVIDHDEIVPHPTGCPLCCPPINRDH